MAGPGVYIFLRSSGGLDTPWELRFIDLDLLGAQGMRGVPFGSFTLKKRLSCREITYIGKEYWWALIYYLLSRNSVALTLLDLNV